MKQEFKHVQVAKQIVPVFVVECAPGWARKELSRSVEHWCWKQIPRAVESVARGVPFDRLPVILDVGCDAEPTDAVISASPYLDKVLEYGCDGDQVVQFFLQEKLDWTYREVSADLPQAELAELTKTFPTVIRSEDGSKLWLSRVPADDRRVTTGYETEYARWIPGNPFEALRGLVILGADLAVTVDRTRAALARASRARWE